VIGWGSVGNAAMLGMRNHHQVVAYDIDGRGEWKNILQADVVLVCVNTDADNNGSLDISNIVDVTLRLEQDRYEGVVIVKSTIYPGTMDSLEMKHPELKLVYMPEFLREKDAIEWFANPDRIIVSGNDGDVDLALSAFLWVDAGVPRIRMKHIEAELGKLAHNAYIATKVTFTCEIERICLSLDANPHLVMETVWVDRRIQNASHLTPGLGGFAGKCVPKDTSALAKVDFDPDSLLKILEERGGYDAVAKRLDGR
jgi:UDPglucose 6-dehydrogenase